MTKITFLSSYFRILPALYSPHLALFWGLTSAYWLLDCHTPDGSSLPWFLFLFASWWHLFSTSLCLVYASVRKMTGHPKENHRPSVLHSMQGNQLMNRISHRRELLFILRHYIAFHQSWRLFHLCLLVGFVSVCLRYVFIVALINFFYLGMPQSQN